MRAPSPRGAGTHLPRVLPLRRPGVGTAREEDGTRVPACSPSPTAGGGRRRLWPAGRGEAEGRGAGRRGDSGRAAAGSFHKEAGSPESPGGKTALGWDGGAERHPRQRAGGPEQPGMRTGESSSPPAVRQGSRRRLCDLSFPVCKVGSRGRVQESAPCQCGPRPRSRSRPAGKAAGGGSPLPSAPDTPGRCDVGSSLLRSLPAGGLLHSPRAGPGSLRRPATSPPPTLGHLSLLSRHLRGQRQFYNMCRHHQPFKGVASFHPKIELNAFT